MRLILTPEQSKKLSTANGQVEVIDAQGRRIGEFTITEPTLTETHEFSDEDFAELRRHLQESPLEKGPLFKAHQVRHRS